MAASSSSLIGVSPVATMTPDTITTHSVSLLVCGGLSSRGFKGLRRCNSFATYGRIEGVFIRRLMAVAAKKKPQENNKVKSDSYAVRPDESTGPFPEAVLLKQKDREDGRRLPEFEDAEEEQLFQKLNLQLESDLNVDRLCHYEVVYMIHEKYAEIDLVFQISTNIEFLKEKKGKTWRVSDWGMRRLAYKIQKASRAHYLLMNFELEAKWINEFKELLDKDERVIRHLVIKRDEAITEDCPPPP